MTSIAHHTPDLDIRRFRAQIYEKVTDPRIIKIGSGENVQSFTFFQTLTITALIATPDKRVNLEVLSDLLYPDHIVRRTPSFFINPVRQLNEKLKKLLNAETPVIGFEYDDCVLINHAPHIAVLFSRFLEPQPTFPAGPSKKWSVWDPACGD